jgi:hypothetical protein
LERQATRSRAASPFGDKPATATFRISDRGKSIMSDALHTGGLLLPVNLDVLVPIIERAVDAAVSRLERRLAEHGHNQVLTEEEAAAILGLAPHVLRDERRRGRISASRIVGRRIRYVREDLFGYLDATKIAKR